ncbi:MAG: phosphoglycerate kinase [Candidatus Levybacteria bacterium]|nr:phosphoglycerate kinase [Candidatus Levybacteria bacterium]
MTQRSISEIDNLQNKNVLVRIDSDVDIKNDTILDDTRLLSSLETIEYIINHGGNAILMGHLGRPDGKINPEYSLEIVAKWYAKRFKGAVKQETLEEFSCWKITDNLLLLENIRFNKGEEENDEAFAKKLASLGDIFVNEAFAVSHRAHATTVGIAKLLPSYAGFHLQKEVKTLENVMKNPKRPLAVLIGGAKIETKLPIVEKMHHIADYVLVGGKIAEETKILIKVQHEKIVGHKSAVLVADNTIDGLDITDKDAENFMQIMALCKTIVWNGPVGKMGDPKTEANSLKIAKSIIDSGAYSVVGGGDSLTLLEQHHLLNKFSFVSTGGGAMLEFLSGKKLPGISILE